MQAEYLLTSGTARRLYEAVKDLPILDYHCHLSPQQIWEDQPFDNIGAMWLGGDHYKWRLMRQAGVPEERITGSASDQEKFAAYAQTIASAAGNPLYHWTKMELSQYFHIEEPLNETNWKEIWEKANQVIREERLSPRSLILRSRVRYLATTDDVADSLEYHKKLQQDDSFPVTVAPSFRTDQVLQITRPDYVSYVSRLSVVSKVDICDLDSLLHALLCRLDVFQQEGCRFTDVGIPVFPRFVGSKQAAAEAFAKALRKEPLTEEEYHAFLGYLYVFLGCEYRRRGLVMQWHLAVARNVNTGLFQQLGPDCGADTVGDLISGTAVARILDAICQAGGTPETVLYSLNPVMHAQLASIAGSFEHVRCGAAWWFCDHKRGIEEVLCTVAETGYLGSFLGMLTDSRSFLSYARHDYFRRILCSLIGNWIDSGEFEGDGEELAGRLSYHNIRSLIENDTVQKNIT